MYDNNAVCKGALCRKSDRRFKSCISDKKGCGLCMVQLDKENKIHCTFDELLMSDNPIIKEKLKLLLKENKIIEENEHINIYSNAE